MKNIDELESLFSKLKTCSTEEEVLSYLKDMVKGFSPSQFKERIELNPYYKSLIPDVKIEVLNDIQSFRDSILNEIRIIEDGIKQGGEDTSKFMELKYRCDLLLNDLYFKELEVKSILI